MIPPCPFCGGTDIRIQNPTCTRESPYDPADRAFPQAVCQGCYACAPGDNWDRTGMSAIKAWSKRVDQGMPV